jgi:UDPglucose 6-dehydrogenase
MRLTGPAIEKISVFGLGKLGSVIAGCWASRGFEVVGVDPNPRSVDAIRSGRAPVEETHLERLIEDAADHLAATTDGHAAVRDTQMTMVVVPTPSRSDGGYALDYVEAACRTIGQAIRNKESDHLVVLKSTVLPGACDASIIPLLEQESGKRCGEDFGFCYNPEFIALGSVLKNLLEPDFLLIGEADPAAGDALVSAHSRMLGDPPPMPRMSCANAELAKIAVNSFVTMKITFANLIAQLCEELPDGDAGVVSDAIGLDTRIGRKYLSGGLGFGGPCFPRDNAALLHVAGSLNVPFPLAAATDEANQTLPGRIVDKITAELFPGARTAVLGLSYKPETPVIEESQGVAIARELARRGMNVRVYDPMALAAAREALGSVVDYAESVEECIDDADAVIVATPWNEFAQLPAEKLNPQGPRLIYDCWNSVNGIGSSVARHRVLGRAIEVS